MSTEGTRRARSTARNTPSLRLPLGADVVEKIKRQAVALGRTVTDWEAVAKSADFPVG